MFSQDECSHNEQHNHQQKTGSGSRLPWLLAAVLGTLLLFQYFGTGNALSGFQWSTLLSLICPLMMLFMMFGHKHSQDGGGGCCGGHQTNENIKKE